MVDYIIVSDILNDIYDSKNITSFLEGKSILNHNIVFLDMNSTFYSMSTRKGPNEYIYPTQNKYSINKIYRRIRELRHIGETRIPIVLYGFKENVFFKRKHYKKLMVKHLFDTDIFIIDEKIKEGDISLDSKNLSIFYKCKIIFAKKSGTIDMPCNTKAYYTPWRKTILVFWDDFNINKFKNYKYIIDLYETIRQLPELNRGEQL